MKITKIVNNCSLELVEENVASILQRLKDLLKNIHQTNKNT